MSEPKDDDLDLESLGNDEFFKDLDALIGDLDTPADIPPGAEQEPAAQPLLDESTGADDETAMDDLTTLLTEIEESQTPPAGSEAGAPATKDIPILKDVVFKAGSMPGEAVSMLAALKTVKNTENPITAADIERMVEESIDRHLEQVREELRETILTQINQRVLRCLPKGGPQKDGE